MSYPCNTGTFLPTYTYSQAVDFSTPILNDHWTIAIPIASGDSELASFLYPLSYEVWIATIVSVPLFIVAFMLTDYVYIKSMTNPQKLKLKSEWMRSTAFVMRTVLVDNSLMHMTYNYKRILIFTWAWVIFILLQAYAGTLTSMITRPALKKPIKNADDLVSQEDVSWVMEDGLGVGDFMKASPVGSTLRQLVEKASFLDYDEEWYGACQTKKTWKSKKFATICDIYSITDLISNDYR